MNERRRKIIPISHRLLAELLTTSDRAMTIRCTEGLPPDARFVSYGYDVQCDMHYLVFESDAWEPVEEFTAPPMLRPQFRRYNVRTLVEDAAMLIADEWEGAKPESQGRQWLREYEQYFKDALE